MSRVAQVVESGAIYEAQGTSMRWIIITILETKCQSKEKSLVVMPWPILADSQIERIDKKKPTQEWLSHHIKVGNLLTVSSTAVNVYVDELREVLNLRFLS